MIGTKAAGTKIGGVDGLWLPGQGVWLQAPDWHGSLPLLKRMLFARHGGSWYGEKVEKHALHRVEGLLLPPLVAMDYLSAPRPVALAELAWSPRVAALMAAAGWVRKALLNGWYAPDLARWSAGELRWKAAVPGGARDEEAEWARLVREAEARGLGGLASWPGDALTELLAEDEAAAEALRGVIAATGADLSAGAAADEEDWLVGIGWMPDETPFRVLLRLQEPDAGGGWRLSAALQGRNGGAPLVLLRPGGAGGWQVEDGELPADWARWVESRLAREEAKWLAALPELAAEEAGCARLRTAIGEEEAWQFLQTGSVRLLQAGCPVMLPAWWEEARRRRLRLRAKVKSSVGSSEQPMFGLNQIVQFDWKLAVGDLDLSEEEFIRLAAENRRLLNVRGEWVHLDPADVKAIQGWIKRAGRRKGMSFRDVLEWHLRGESPLEADGGEAEDGSAPLAEIELNEHLAAWLERLQDASELPAVAKPRQFLGELRPYQLEGVAWLSFLRRFGLGGCLADDMGLGKTIQFTAYLLHVKESETAQRPSLLICPTSVIGNWEKELARFAPELAVYVHYGPRRAKGDAFVEATEGVDLVITSYALAPLDDEELAGAEWDALCLDEAQNIKNVYTKQSSAIRRFAARHRIALTGTPMENRLTELWSIYDFLNPGYLGSLGEFRREVVQPIERTRDEEMIGRLQKWVKPFMLRRLKKDPAIQLSLPDKNEMRTYISLTAEQGAMYEQTVAELLEGLDGLGPMKRRGLILATLMRLKQLCDHPSLLTGDGSRAPAGWETERSGKLVRLLEMVDEIAARGERCLIFTQFVDMGEMIRAKLEERLGLAVPFLHGGVQKRDRDAMIGAFQDVSQLGCAFVLSLKAGGTGLNLTAANHVFHFDRWWNPAVENQATDRAFRIGQTKDVQVHKFVSIGTLEERIDDMLTSKQQLSEQVVGQSEGWITELDKEELRSLFTLRRTWTG